jgi:energy-coupling factor transporter ATP-binding protein EcfA2
LLHGHVDLGELTVVLGGNDAGKSHLLELVASALREPLHSETDQSAVYFFELTPSEMPVVVAHAAGELLRDDEVADDSRDFPIVDRAAWKLGGWRNATFAKRTLGLHGGFDDYLALLEEHRPEPADSWAIVLAELRASLLVAARRGVAAKPDGTRRTGWMLSWCLPPLDQLADDVRSAVRGLGLAHLEPKAHQDGTVAVFAQPGAPVTIAPIGLLELPVVPVPITAPTGFAAIRAALEEALGKLVVHTREALTARVESFGNLEWTPTPVPEVFLNSGGAGVHPDLLTACRFVERTADTMLPRFLTQRYEIHLATYPLLDWRTRGVLDLRLRDRDAGSSFPIDAVAQGHRLWLQLVLLEAVNAVDRLRITLELELERDLPHLEDAFHELDEAQEDPSKILDAHEVARIAGRSGYVSAIEAFRAERLQPVSADLAAVAREMANFAWEDSAKTHAPGRELVAPTRARLYVIDEPEQHLHPRLQRQAARWLIDFLRARPSQAVIATHAAAFINSGVGARLTYARRPAGGTTELTSIPAGRLAALDREAADLGLDRGELLAMTSVLLFVEGRSDQKVLEELYAERLAHAGITVVPMHGASRAVGIAEAETLLRFTTARVAVWLDNVPPDVLRRLKSDPAFTAEVKSNTARKYGSEEKTMADLILTARRHGRQVEPLPHPGIDVFDLLDEEAIRAHHPAFPGHAEARRRATAERERSGTKWKPYYAEAFGVSLEADALGRVARTMRERGVDVAALDNVVLSCERLGLGIE